MNHADDPGKDRELFDRFEAEMTEAGGDVVDLDKARAERAGTASVEVDSAESSAAAADEEAEEGKPVPVDPPDLAKSGVTEEKRRPILPGALQDRTAFLSAARRVGAHVGYASLYHGLRLPYYGAALTVNAPRGAARFLTSTNEWVWDMEAAPLRAAAVREERTGDYMALARRRDRRVRLRTLVSAVSAVFGLGLALSLYVLAPGWLGPLAGVSVLACGFAGQAKDHPVIGPAVLKTEVPKLTSSIVLRGLGAIGNAKISAAIKKGGDMDGMRFVFDICRDGPGYRADLDLPYGVVPEDVMEERKALASGLRRKMGSVWPSGDPTEHEGRLVLWVGDKPMNETKKPAWPLAKSGTVDLFKPVVFANDQRMRPMTVTLMFASVVVGSIPRMGKTFLLRLFLLICALDPRATLYMFDFKGTGDFGPLEPVAHRYTSGDEDENVEYCLHALREIKEELRRRAKVIKSLPTSVCPESKVTSALASDKRYGLHPIAVALDECQVAFEHEKYGAEVESICTDITKRGPALGIIGMFGTQRPDKHSLPRGISANAVLRFALKVMGQIENDMILGTSMYKAGYRATMFSRSDLGIAWMSGEGDDPRIVCGAFIDAPAAASITARARAVRKEYGNVTGHAIGEEPAKGEALDILSDVLKAVPAKEKKVWCERIAQRLGDLRPDVYAEWEGETVTNALKPYGIKAGQVWGQTDEGEGANRRGIARVDLVAAITERDKKRSTE